MAERVWDAGRGPCVVAVAALLAGFPGAGPSPLDAQGAWPPLEYGECAPGQVEVMTLGTFHFAQQEGIEILSPDRQRELESLVAGLSRFAPTRVAVEYPYARNDTLLAAYARYLEGGGQSTSRNEIVQVGFRLARRLGHARVHAVDVPMNLWHDSIQVYDDAYPGSRNRLRAAWRGRYPASPARDPAAPLATILKEANRDDPPANSEMYAGFLPLVEDDMYAGALKLRPWYDRNLRIVQNLFRIASGPGERIVLVIGHGHLRVLKQMLDMTPQLCAVDVIPYLD